MFDYDGVDQLTEDTQNMMLEDPDKSAMLLDFDMVVEINSDGEEQSPTPTPIPSPPPKSNEINGVQKRIAKKSTTVDTKQPSVSTRRQAALATAKKNYVTGHDRFMENFDPESSVRERRKLTRKVNAVVTASARKVVIPVYDDLGIHINSGIDLCDCLKKTCPGCHFPCAKCESLKCGPECRCNRKFVYDSIEYHGCSFSVRNPFHK